jgi:amidase
MCEVLDVLVAADADTSGDFWRLQPWVDLPAPADVCPESFAALYSDVRAADTPLAGKRFAVPRMFIDKDPDQGTGEGMGASTGKRIDARPSMLALWKSARADLEAAGAEVIETDFPVVTNYEADRVGAPSVLTRGIVSNEFIDVEAWELSMWGWDTFLALNGQAGLDRLAQVDGPNIFPRHPEDTLDQLTTEIDVDIAEYVTRAQTDGVPDPFTSDIAPVVRAGLEGLEETRRIDMDDWLRDNNFDAAIFPTLSDIAPSDADQNPVSSEIAWRNGVWVATGNLAIRHLGIPTVTVPMGTAADIHMPFGLTFAGAAYSDSALIHLATAFEALRPRRTAPPRTPEL